MHNLRETLENQQIKIYFATVVAAGLVAYAIPSATVLEAAISPALAFMLFVTFLQVPIAELGRAFLRVRFLGTLMAVNFVAIPVLVLGLIQFLPTDPMIRIGVLLVLLTPCIDYVVTFSHLGRADAKLLLAATPALLIAQMALLPVYLRLFLGDDAHGLVQMGPFVHAFVWLIAVPLIGAGVLQLIAGRNACAARLSAGLGLLPVPATALVLFVVVAGVVPQLGLALEGAVRALPVYLAFAVLAPAIAWFIARLNRLDIPAARAIAFSAGTRNSLVVLPLAFAIPNAMPLLPAIIVTQTLVELVSELLYIRVIGRLGDRAVAA
ncbi:MULTISPECIES: arsenic resistance protein [unclassified Rhizobium]|uniref:arsenic resistance protein n=1 Tax=unclassified Rhizobium TaxID=2613769 RepID=UPI0028893F7B|nr:MULTISPECIES: arsenic resistance protein [unclassified Rhizobium]